MEQRVSLFALKCSIGTWLPWESGLFGTHIELKAELYKDRSYQSVSVTCGNATYVYDFLATFNVFF